MKALLEKFRINFTDLVVIEDPTSQPPSNYSLNWFDGLIRPFIQREQEAGEFIVFLNVVWFNLLII